ncbi:hypothetical protein [Bacillus pumilus]|uniref:hypothetical protein n=1 Tax=Bacillus pumilus TaxID=1408 RepID=UPI003D70EA8C
MAHDDWDKREFEVANAKLLEGSMVFEATGVEKEKSMFVIGSMANGKESKDTLRGRSVIRFSFLCFKGG